MRGHGQIIPIAFNTPVISLENHPKHKGLMQEFDLLEYNLELSNNFEEVLFSKISLLEINVDSLVYQYRNINKELFNSSYTAWGKIKKSIK